MSIKRLSFILLAFIIAVSSFNVAESYAAGKGKASTSQTSSKKKKKKTSSKSKKKSGTATKKTKKSSKSRSVKRSSAKRTTYTPPAPETPSFDSLTLRINDAVLQWVPDNLNPGGLRVNSVKPDSTLRLARIGLNENFTYLPVTREMIDSLSRHVAINLPDSIADYKVSLNVGNKNLSYYITKVDKLPEQFRKNPPFVVAAKPLANPTKGMEGDIIALWHSHGRYYRPSGGGWLWQRPLLFQTVEDTYPMSYILPFVVPMLENAGAYVLLPRERDTNKNEVIVDNDTNEDGAIYSQPYYKEMNGAQKWETGELEGFIYDLPDFRDTENPFENGTYRQTLTVKEGTSPSAAAWYADIPEDGEYAVYVSYKTLENSPSDARYTVNYSGGSKEFHVNQTMGGSTWVYLGTFPLKKGYSETLPIVTLSNISAEPGKTLTADAVKIGGGMGNIARSPKRADIYYDPSVPQTTAMKDDTTETEEDEATEGDEENEETEETESNQSVAKKEEKESTPVPEKPKGPAPVFRTSGMPRFLEGARYWLHWAGFPEDVYSPYHGADDYKDDYTSRGHWVNYLAGGSRVLPDEEGLNIPVDMAMALHTDAGKRSDDSFVGTLGIYFTQNGTSYTDGTPRINSRMLTDLIMRQITSDVRQEYEPAWTRRSMWDKSYVEARVPEVPTSLIELMSHQNFADMMYGLDPTFRFTVSRAIYKGIARFMAERKDRKLVIQPLPVSDFAIKRTKKDHYRLEWKPTEDRLEPTAKPEKYIILERSSDQLGFHKIGETAHTHFDIKCHDNDIHSFRVIAVNDGGLSFPSETLAFREATDDSAPVLVINGFTRVSGPGVINSDGKAGFDGINDYGVPYINDVAFTGYQTEFRRSAGEAHGRSGSEYVTTVVAGNTFDYPAIHGRSIAAAGHGFVSCSAGAVESGEIDLNDFKTIDLILGKQKTTIVGNGRHGLHYAAFPEKLKNEIEDYVKKGGDLLVSGEYVVSDLSASRYAGENDSFLQETLGVVKSEGEKSTSGRLKGLETEFSKGRSIPYSSTLNEKQYIVENPDILAASPDRDSEVVMVFSDTDNPAAIFNKKGKNRNIIMSVPFESIQDASLRDALMKEFLDYLQH